MKTLKINDNSYRGLVANICREITVSGWKPDYIVGIVRGGAVPAVMISHYFDIPCYALRVSLRDHSEQESNFWMQEDAFGYVDNENKTTYGSRWDPSLRKKILIVDDINDTGETLNWIVQDWQGTCLPDVEIAWKSVWHNNVRFAAVVENLGSKFATDYCGMEINKSVEDVWVEFPYERWWI